MIKIANNLFQMKNIKFIMKIKSGNYKIFIITKVINIIIK